VGWFEVSRERLGYRGRIDRAPYDRWIATGSGAQAIEAAASQLRFRLLGRKRAARRDIWNRLSGAARQDPLRSALDATADLFMGAMSDLAYASALPRTQIALRRVVLVPRVMVAGRGRSTAIARLMRSPGMPDVDDAVKAFFGDEVLAQLDAALQRARPAPSRPVGAPQQWKCVGVETSYAWVDPYWSGPEWFGHLFLYEWPPAGLSRRDRKALEGAIVDLQSAVGTLSRDRRNELVRLAATA
jgi:hypothetical protein